MAIEFDLGYPGFRDSLEVMGRDATNAVANVLEFIHARLEMNEFAATYGWTPYYIDPIDTYPGTDPMYHFSIPFGATRIEVFGRLQEPERITCVMARLP